MVFRIACGRRPLLFGRELSVVFLGVDLTQLLLTVFANEWIDDLRLVRCNDLL